MQLGLSQQTSPRHYGEEHKGQNIWIAARVFQQHGRQQADYDGTLHGTVFAAVKLVEEQRFS
jgi:hypothetical protein